jgi:hypothetical protein
VTAAWFRPSTDWLLIRGDGVAIDVLDEAGYATAYCHNCRTTFAGSEDPGEVEQEATDHVCEEPL